MTSRVDLNEEGFVTGFPYHDGFLDGLLLGDDRCLHLAIRAVSGERRILTLRGVKASCVDDLREGNVLLNLRILPVPRAVGEPEVLRMLVERLHMVPARLDNDALVFWLESSYGAEIVAVCDYIEARQGRLRLEMQE